MAKKFTVSDLHGAMDKIGEHDLFDNYDVAIVDRNGYKVYDVQAVHVLREKGMEMLNIVIDTAEPRGSTG